MFSEPTLGYWDIRGFGEPIRLMLRYAGVKFIDKRYPFGPGKTVAEAKSVMKFWLPDKQTGLGLDFPNLVYYIDGDVKLTQSITIMRYLARKHKLIAKDDPTLTRQELAEQQVCDMRTFLLIFVMQENYQDKKKEYISDRLIPQLETFAKFLGSNDWLSPELSYVDFLAYESLDWLRLFTPETFDKYPTLVQYLNRFKDLKPIKEYMNSSDYKEWPIFMPIDAVDQWGYVR